MFLVHNAAAAAEEEDDDEDEDFSPGFCSCQ